MKELRKRFERFCLKNRTKGLPNLMLYLAAGNLIVYLLTAIDPSYVIYSALRFHRDAILHGQLWRLFTYILTYAVDVSASSSFSGPLLAAVSLFCFYQFGKILESHWGSFRFNLYYLTGMLLTDLAALILGFSVDSSALNFSLFLAVATIAPDARVLLLFVIPIKFKYMAWVYLAETVFSIVRALLAYRFLSFAWLIPLVPLANYFLFFGSEIRNLFPASWQRRRPGGFGARPQPNRSWAGAYQSKSGERPYRHKCAVCGRTDTEYPNLEFRYCSKCKGYYCYCIDHINNHVHIT